MSAAFNDGDHPRSAGGEFVARVHTSPAVELNGEGDAYILVEGGLVQNSPSLPVIDLDFLKDQLVDENAIDSALEVRSTAAGLGLAATVAEIDRWGSGLPGWSPLNTSAFTAAADDSYVLMRGGLVQNSPSLPVIDLDFLDTGDHSDLGTARETRDVCISVGRPDLALHISRWIQSVRKTAAHR